MNVRCDYGTLDDDSFTLDSTDYTVQSVRWGTRGLDNANPRDESLHLTLDKVFPSAELAFLTLRVGAYSLPGSVVDCIGTRAETSKDLDWFAVDPGARHSQVVDLEDPDSGGVRAAPKGVLRGGIFR